MKGRLTSLPRVEWAPAARDRSREPDRGPCRPSCCKSPYGHSTVRDGFPAWHKEACHCHETPKEMLDRLLAGDQEGTEQ